MANRFDGFARYPMTVNVEFFFAPNCSACEGVRAGLYDALAELPGAVTWQELNVLDHIERAVELGILRTPAIVMDGELVFSAPPSRKAFLAAVRRRLAVA